MARAGIAIATTLTPARLRAEARCARCSRAAARMMAIANALEMTSRTAAAEFAGFSVQALRDVVLRYNAGGLDGLYDRPGKGRKPKLAAEQQAELAEIVRKGPDVETEGLSAYTLDDLARIAKERWDVSVHPSSMSRIVRKLGFSRQKARKLHPAQDPAAAAAFKKSPGAAENGCHYT